MAHWLRVECFVGHGFRVCTVVAKTPRSHVFTRDGRTAHVYTAWGGGTSVQMSFSLHLFFFIYRGLLLPYRLLFPSFLRYSMVVLQTGGPYVWFIWSNTTWVTFTHVLTVDTSCDCERETCDAVGHKATRLRVGGTRARCAAGSNRVPPENFFFLSTFTIYLRTPVTFEN